MREKNWPVVMACFVINLLVLGSGRLTPIYYVECITRFHTTRKEASFPFVLCYVLRSLCGPLIGISGRKFGLKETTMFGCFFSVIGIGLCYFAEDIITVTILFGVVYGLGFGYSSALLPSILTDLYKENQVKVVGFSAAGSSLGSLILPPIVVLSIDYYGVSSSFLVLSAIILNAIPAAMLLKNPKSDQNKGANKSNTTLTKDLSLTSIKPMTKNTLSNEILDISSDNFNIQNRKKHFEVESHTTNLQNCNNNSELNKYHAFQTNKADDTCDTSPNKTGSAILISVHKLDEHYKLNILSSDQSDQVKFSHSNNVKKKESIFDMFRPMVNPIFVIISTVQCMFGFIVVTMLTIVIDITRDKNLSSSTDVYFLACVAVSDMMGRLCLGFVTDKGYMTRTNYAALCHMLMGIFLVLIVVSFGFVLLLIECFIFYGLIGALFVTFPSIINEFIVSEQRTMAMASRTFLLGPLCLAISPLIGYFRDSFGSYDWFLYILAMICIICSVVTWFTPWISKRWNGKV